MRLNIILFCSLAFVSCKSISYYENVITYRAISKYPIYGEDWNTYHSTVYINDTTFYQFYGSWRGSDTLCQRANYKERCKELIHSNSTLYSPNRHDTFYVKSSDIYTYYKGNRITYLSYSAFNSLKPTYKVYSLGSSNYPQVEILRPLYKVDSGLISKIYVYERTQYQAVNEELFLSDLTKDTEVKRGLVLDKEANVDTMYILPGIGVYYFYNYRSRFQKELIRIQDIQYNKEFIEFYKENYKDWQ